MQKSSIKTPKTPLRKSKPAANTTTMGFKVSADTAVRVMESAMQMGLTVSGYMRSLVENPDLKFFRGPDNKTYAVMELRDIREFFLEVENNGEKEDEG